MISSIGSSGRFDPSAMASRIFKKVDTSEDDSIDLSELQSVAESGANIDPSQLISDIDTDQNGAIDSAELESALQKLSEAMNGGRAQRSKGMGPPPDPKEMFAAADTDGNGSVSKEEFSAMGPEGSDQSRIDEMFATFDTDGNGEIDEAENSAAFEKMGPPPPPNGSDGAASSVSSLAADSITSGSLSDSSLVELLKALSPDSDSNTTSSNKALQSIKKLVEELQSGTTYGNQGTLAVSLSGTRSLFTATA